MRWLTPMLFPTILLVGCGGGAIGALEPEFVRTAAERDTRQARIYVRRDGAVRGLSVYHADAAVPSAVLAAGAAEFPGRAILYYETEWYAADGQVFEVEYALDDGRSGELAARADGTVVYVERPLTLEALPASVRTAVLARAPGALLSAERKRGPGRDEFGVKVRLGEQTHYLQVSPVGQILHHGLRIPAEIDVPFSGSTSRSSPAGR